MSAKSASVSVSVIKNILSTKFQNYRTEFSKGDNKLEDKFNIANLFGSYLEGVRDALGALEATPDDMKLVEMAERVNKADIEKVESEYALLEALG